jgi:hypothetical protein
MESKHHQKEFFAGSLFGPMFLILLLSEEGRTWVTPWLWWVLLVVSSVGYVFCVWHMVASFGTSFRSGVQPFLSWALSEQRLIYVALFVGGLALMTAGMEVARSPSQLMTLLWAIGGGTVFAGLAFIISPLRSVERTQPDGGVAASDNASDNQAWESEKAALANKLSSLESQLTSTKERLGEKQKQLDAIEKSRLAQEDRDRLARALKSEILKFSDQPKSDNWKAYAGAISLLEGHAKFPVNESGLQAWIEMSNRIKEVIAKGNQAKIEGMPPMPRIALRESVPTTWQPRNFSSINDEHNKHLNLITYWIEYLQQLKEEAAKEPLTAAPNVEYAHGVEKEQQRLKLREMAEAAYANEAHNYVERSELSREQKALSIAIDVLEKHLPFTIKSDQELEEWLELLEQKKHVIGVLSALYGYGPPIPEGGPPPSREVKQFHSFNARHNEALNAIDYHLEVLRESLKQADARAGAQ